jgi:hypothetical protein
VPFIEKGNSHNTPRSSAGWSYGCGSNQHLSKRLDEVASCPLIVTASSFKRQICCSTHFRDWPFLLAFNKTKAQNKHVHERNTA